MSAATPLNPTTAPPGGRAHKRVRWQKKPGPRQPKCIEATRAELVRGLELRQGSIWMRVKDSVTVAGYTLGLARERVRAFRSDGAESMLAMAVTLLQLADVRTGFIGRPRPGGGRWHRYTLRDIAQLAYGGQADADVRRATRAIAGMVSIGWASPTKQVKRMTPDATFRSEPGVRFLNLKRICAMAGTSWLLESDRRHADQKHGTNTASFEEARAAKAEREKRIHDRKQRAYDELEAAKARMRAAVGPPAGDGPPKTGGPRSGFKRLGDIFGGNGFN